MNYLTEYHTKWTEEWLLSTVSGIWDMQLCNFKRHLMWWNTQHFMHEVHRVPIVPHKWPIKFTQYSHNSPWMTFPGSRHPTHPSVSRMSLSPRNSCAQWQRDHLPWWVTCEKLCITWLIGLSHLETKHPILVTYLAGATEEPRRACSASGMTTHLKCPLHVKPPTWNPTVQKCWLQAPQFSIATFKGAMVYHSLPEIPK